MFLAQHADNVYNFPTFNCQGVICKTNLPATTSMRAPGVSQSIFAMEDIMDSVGLAVGHSGWMAPHPFPCTLVHCSLHMRCFVYCVCLS